MKAGQRIVVSFPARLYGPKEEGARVARTTAAMRPLPPGYVPVRFDDGARLLVSEQHIRRAA